MPLAELLTNTGGRMMPGQYTLEEIMQMAGEKRIIRGRIIRRTGNNFNYYIQHEDGSWTNYDCRTKY